jgi:EAL domain-containing protein (putative c-di-GMP-specific phosphodiesterase class I)
MGCHYLQGYYLSRPIGGAELLQLATATVAAPLPV